jgi:hypothetical protein
VFRWPASEPLLTREELNGLIALAMEIDARTERILRILEEDGGKELEEDDA